MNRPTDPNESVNGSDWQNGEGKEFHTLNSGLTKREYFAAQALAGITAAFTKMVDPSRTAGNVPTIAADWAVCYADALIERLNER